MKILGIDEAGRGPVIGSMTIAGVMIEEEKEENLKNIGVKDSKLLAPRKRAQLKDSVEEIALAYKVIEVSVDEIDESVAGNNLNWLEAIKSALIINELKPDVAIIDCPMKNTKSYSDYLEKLLTHKCKLICENKADANYPVVSAASILAKEERERLVHEIKMKIRVDIGSGYPSDPKTKEFVAEYYNKYPELFRKSWSTYKKAAEKGKQKTLF